MASHDEKPDVAKATKIRQAASTPEPASKRHRGKSWEAVRSARKSFFDKISSSGGK